MISTDIVAPDLATNLNFFEVTMLGQQVRKYNVPYALHLEICEMPNGNFLVASHSPPGAPYEDVVVEIEQVWQFDNDKSVFTKYTGYTQDLNGSRLAAYMWVSENTPRIVEINSNNEVTYEATLNRGTTSYYRTLKVNVYDGME